MSPLQDDPGLEALERACRRIEAAPESGAALLLYGLLKTMQMEPRGSPFALTRLRLLDADTRTLVYELMELHARQANRLPRWQALVRRMDEVVGRASPGPD